jgi:hypothetical protein
MLLSYFSSQKFSFCLVAFTGVPDRGDSPEERAESSIGPADANTMGLLGERACSHERRALTWQSIASRRAMDGLRNCICAATLTGAVRTRQTACGEESVMTCFSVSYAKQNG